MTNVRIRFLGTVIYENHLERVFKISDKRKVRVPLTVLPKSKRMLMTSRFTTFTVEHLETNESEELMVAELLSFPFVAGQIE